MKKGFKETELGVIPVDWISCTFEDVLSGFSSGQTPYRGNPQYYTGSIKWITSGELNYNIIYDTIEKITQEAVNDTNLKVIPPGTFLFAITGLEAEGTRGSCAITGVFATTNQSCMALYPSNKIVTEYLFHFYVLFGNELALRYCQGTKQQSYTAGVAKKLPIILPPSLSEQQKIATVLSDTDALIAATEHVLAKKRLVKQATLQNLLSGKTRLPGFGGEWENKTLEEIANINMGQSPNSSTYNNKQVGIPLIQGNADIRNRKSIIRVFTNQITKKCYQGDIILTVRAPVGEVAIASHDSCIGRGVCSISSTIVNQQYLFYVLLNNEDKWKDYEQGSTFTSANSNQIKGFSIFISTDIEEQTAIAEVLTALDEELTALEQQLAKYRLLKQGLMQELLSGKTRLV